MTRRVQRALTAGLLAAMALPMAAGPAGADHREPTEPNAGDAVAACYGGTAGVPLGEGTCRGIEQLARNGAQGCRFAGAPDAACSALDGQAYSPAAMAHYEASSVHQALALQAHLDDDTPLGLALVPGTHNSFNSAAYAPTLSGLDHNQVASLSDQLRMDMRSLELDVHWFPSPHGDPAEGGFAPILCHGQTQDFVLFTFHIGCTAERHLRDGLAEVRAWLDDHPAEFLVLYLENQLDGDPVAHAAAARTIEAELGPRVVPTPAGRCDAMPSDRSENELRASQPGAQVLVVGNPQPGRPASPWCALVHDRFGNPTYNWDEDKSADGDDFVCPSGEYAHRLQRYYEDSTWLSHTVEPTGFGSPGEITPDETAAMVACGVNLFGFDQLVPGDGRLEALVWSWAPGEPTGNGAASSGADGRFRATRPGSKLAFACRAADGTWRITTRSGPWAQGPRACAAEFAGSTFAVPATGADNQTLVEVKGAAGVAKVWLNERVRGS